MQKWFMQILTRYRGWVIFLIALPISFIFNLVQTLRNIVFRAFFANAKYHDKKVLEIQAAVKAAFEAGQKMCTARKPWKTMSLRVATFKDNCAKIPINLKDILHLDTVKQTVRVEPMVTMGEITHFLVPRGFALAVQVEMDDLTIGGLCMGVGIETSSHRYGFLFETIEAFELITADGTRLCVSRTENVELFHALPWSHGTLGFLVAVELKVVPVKAFMRLEYLPCHSQAEFCEKFNALAEAKQPVSFLEALVFSPTESVILCGEFSDGPVGANNKINPINRWYKKWFYTHVEDFLKLGNSVEYIPLRHYFHRHTPSVFFQLKELIPFANKAWYRYLFAWLGAPKISLMKLTYTKALRREAMFKRVTQDIIVPLSDMNESLDFMHSRFSIYPMWICPVRLFNHHENEGFLYNPPASAETNHSAMYVDIGVYGIPQAVVEEKPWDMIAVSRELEAFTLSKQGYHLLYADIFMTRAEFKKMFNHALYDQMRERYHAQAAFPEVYDKVIPESWLLNIDALEKN